MKRSTHVLWLFMLIASLCFADNPVVQTCYTADPAPLVYNGRVYMYVGHDSIGATTTYLMPDWKCYSSADMVNWTDHGVVLSPRAFTWATTKVANASQVIYKNGKFYFFASTTASDGVAVGLAVSNSPLGPFKDTLGKPLVAGSQMNGCNATHSWRGLDPTVFIDEDGQTYLYWGNNVLYWAKLSADLRSLSGSISCLPQNDPAFGPDYEEGPWFYRRNNMYYIIYPSRIPESIHYTTSTGPTGPWTYRSEIMAAQQGTGSSSTIHPAVCDFEGRSFFFYHNGALPGGGSYKRSACIEEFTYTSAGLIPRIPPTTAGVTKGVKNLNPYDTVQAETICWSSGVRTSACSEGGIQVDSIHNGDYIKVKGVDFKSGAATFQARVASGASGGNIELRLASTTGTLIGTCAIQGTGGWQTWATRTCTITGATGVQDLFLRFTGSGSGVLFNVNWWKFEPVESGTGDGGRGERLNSMRLVSERGREPVVYIEMPQSAAARRVRVRQFDLSGKLVAMPFYSYVSTTRLTVPLHAIAGVFFVRISVDGEGEITRKVIRP